MNISILVNGRFHFYDLARELSKLKLNILLISTLPKYYIKSWTGLSNRQINAFLLLEIVKRIFDKLKYNSIYFDVFQKKIFAQYCQRKLSSNIDVLIFFAGNGWYSHLLSNLNVNTLLIADEGSAHPNTVNDLLNREYERISRNRNSASRTALDRETEFQYCAAHYIVVPSTFVRDSMIANGIDSSKLYVNPYGVDSAVFVPTDRRKNREFVNVLFCGNLSIQKGGHIFLEVASKFANNNFIKFIHVGGINTELDNLVSEYPHGNFTHYDAVDQSELPRYYQQCDIFLLPSIQDGFGMVVLQAMSCGLAIICSSKSCGNDVVKHGENGFVVEPTAVQDIINHIDNLAKNLDILDSFQNESRTIVMRNFTWAHYGERYFHFINSVKKNRLV